MNRLSYRLLAVLALVLLTASAPRVAAIEYSQAAEVTWSQPQLIYRSDNYVDNPVVVADANENVHVFWTEAATGKSTTQFPTTIVHAMLSDGVWSRPVDVLVAPDEGNIASPEVAADRYGYLHVIFHGANNTLYYTSVEAARAGDSLAWQAPTPIATSWLNTGITIDSSGAIHVAYPGVGNLGVLYIRSLDRGLTWSTAASVAAPHRNDAAPNYAQVAVDAMGGIHIVWTEYQLPNASPALGVFYAHSYDGGFSWSPSTPLMRGTVNQATIKTDPRGGLHVIWNGVIGFGGRYYTQSTDRGLTWSSIVPVVRPGIGGTSGYPDFVSDSASVLHLTTSIGNEIVYSSGQSGAWQTPVKVSGNLTGGDIDAVEKPRVALSQGNRLHGVFEVLFREIYYIEAVTPATMVISTAQPNTPEAGSIAKQSPDAIQPETQTDLDKAVPNVSASQDNTTALFAGIAAGCVVLVLVLAVKLIRIRS